MNSRTLGAILLIIGTCFGGGVLALPLVTAGLNIYTTIFMLCAVWLVMTLNAMYIVEVNLHLPDNANYISMTRATLGKAGASFTWTCYLLLLYTLLSAYLAGGTDLTNGLLHLVDIHFPNWINTFIFLGLFLVIIYQGIRIIDWANRGLMTLKLGSFLLLLLFLLPSASRQHLNFNSNISSPIPAIMPIVLSFGFALIVPSLTAYLKGNARAIKLATLAGSMVPIFAFLFWILNIQSNIDYQPLIDIAQSGQSISQLSMAIESKLSYPGSSFISNLFFSISLTTSFLGVSLSFIDFLIDGFNLRKTQAHERFDWRAIALAFIPPTLIILIKPGIFITTLKFGGALCVILLVLLPTMMAWSACHVKNIIVNKPFYCHKFVLMINIVVAFYLLYLAVITIF